MRKTSLASSLPQPSLVAALQWAPSLEVGGPGQIGWLWQKGS